MNSTLPCQYRKLSDGVRYLQAHLRTKLGIYAQEEKYNIHEKYVARILWGIGIGADSGLGGVLLFFRFLRDTRTRCIQKNGYLEYIYNDGWFCNIKGKPPVLQYPTADFCSYSYLSRFVDLKCEICARMSFIS